MGQFRIPSESRTLGKVIPAHLTSLMPTVGDWPLKVFSVQDATDQLPILRAIITTDLHNLVFQADYRLIPVVSSPPRRRTRPRHSDDHRRIGSELLRSEWPDSYRAGAHRQSRVAT
jgi:hypothetical protein